MSGGAGGGRPAAREPRFWRALLRAVLPADVQHEIVDDLGRRFADRLAGHGARATRRWYRDQVLRTIAPAMRARWSSSGPPRRVLDLRPASGSPRGGSISPVAAVLAALVRDLTSGLRQAIRRPGHTAVIVVVVAVGVGATTVMAAIVQRALVAPLPYADAEELAIVWARSEARGGRFPAAAPDVALVREQVESFAAVGFALRVADMALLREDRARHVRVGIVTPELFDLLGVAPALGRGFTAADAIVPEGAGEDDGPPLPPTALLLSDSLWRGAWGADHEAPGSTARLDGSPAFVAGVLPPDFELVLPNDAGIPRDVDAWLPLRVDLGAFRRDEGRLVDQDSDNAGAAIARLAAGASLERVQAELDALAARLREQVPEYAEAGFGLRVQALGDDVAADSADLMGALSLGVGLLLIVCWVNASTLWLARASGRADELWIRVALGASRARIGRELALEWLLLAAAGVTLGAMAAAAAAPWLEALAGGAPGLSGIRPDATVVVVTALCAAGIGAIIALLPLAALARSAGAGAGLRGGTERVGQVRLRRAFSVVQVALSVVLLAGAGLLGRSTLELLRVDPGFEADDVLTFRMSLRAEGRYRGPAERARFVHDLEGAIAALPGIDAVGLVGRLPLAGGAWSQPYGLPGQPLQDWSRNRADFRMVTSGYFRAMGIRVLAGRGFTAEEDVVEAHRVVVVDDKLAARLAPAGSAVGSAVGMSIGVPIDGRPIDAEIVGVVERVRHDSLRAESREAIYVPYRQEASRDVAFAVRATAIDRAAIDPAAVDRASLDPAALAAGIRDTVARLDPELPVYDVVTMRGHVAESLLPTRIAAGLLAAFGVIAVGSSALGLYGVVALAVGRRRREIGVRMALGATPGQVLRTVLRGGLGSTAVGVVAGTGLALLATRALGGMLYGVGALDPVTWVALLAIVGGVSLLATIVPARRAAAIEPRAALSESAG